MIKSFIGLLDDIVNQVECNVGATRGERLENLFANVCVRAHAVFKNALLFFKVRKHKLKLKSSKTLHKTILKLKSRTKRYYSLFSCNRVVSLQDLNPCT